jgi:RHS repeat-associated protein
MEANNSGSLAGIRRHDYLPFGEELVASTGVQRSGVGYEPPASNVLQKFGSKERDIETGLDFSGARYFSSVQGRFTSPDPLNPIFEYQGMEFIAWLGEPQRWNRYAFALNNPLRYVDQDGEDPIEAALEKAYNRLSRVISRTGGNPLTLAAEVGVEAVRQVFPDIVVKTGGFEFQSEREIAPIVAAFEGKSIEPLPHGQAGVDAMMYYGQTPATFLGNNGFEIAQLKSFDTGNVKNVVDRTRDIRVDIDKANSTRGPNEQYQNVSAYVRVTNPQITANSLVDQLKTDANSSHGGVVGITKGNTLSTVTYFVKGGIVRVQGGHIYSCDEKGKCTQR